MKTRLSVSVDEELVSKMRNLMRSKLFRNKSHVVEYALEKLMRKKK